MTVAAGPVIAVSPPHVHTCDADPRHARPLIRVHSGKRFTLSTTDLSYTAGSPAEKHEVPPPVTFPDAPSLGEFIASHQSELRAAMASALRGRADVDDALQQAYLRLISEYDRWPADQTAQERLAFAADIDLTYMGGIERGKRNPSLLVLIGIADALGCEPVDLFAKTTKSPSGLRKGN